MQGTMKLSQAGRCPIHEVSAPVGTGKAREERVAEQTVYCQQAHHPFLPVQKLQRVRPQQVSLPATDRQAVSG